MIRAPKMRGHSCGSAWLSLVVFCLYCIYHNSSTLKQLSGPSVSDAPYQRTVTNTGTRTAPLQAVTNSSLKSRGYDEAPQKFANNTIEKPWSTIQESSLGVHLFSHSIENIRLIGERHSGTTYLTRHLKRCFPDRSVEDFFVRGKHWFQPTPETVVQAVKTHGRKGLDQTMWMDIANAPHPKRAFDTSLIIVIVRNPYNWLEAMRRKPWHWPNHVEVAPKNTSALVTARFNQNNHDDKRRRRKLQSTTTGEMGKYFPKKEARIYRKNNNIHDTPVGESSGGKLPGGVSIRHSFITHSELDWLDFISRPMQLVDYQDKVSAAGLCQKGYPRGTISPCSHNHSFAPPKVQHIPKPFLRHLPFAINDVVYELAGYDKPYDHPLQLRAAKLQNFLSVVQHWDLGGFALIRYEDILGDGLTAFVEELSRALQVKSQCPILPPFDKPPYSIPEEFRAWITDHSDWELESLLGYEPAG
jgi:hypothetical protein